MTPNKATESEARFIENKDTTSINKETNGKWICIRI